MVNWNLTAKFDDFARNKLISNFNEDDYNLQNINVNEIVVKEIEKSLARQYISTFHYSKTMPDSTRFCYGGFIGDKIVGIVCYGMGCGKNQYTAIIPDIQNGEYIELTRLWCVNSAPRNTESKIISQSLKLLPQEIKLVVSFSDEAEGHCGIIYQATNWYYLGKNKGGKMLLMPNGIKKHPRLLGIYRMRHPEYREYTNAELMNLLNYTYTDGGCKYRYVYLRGDKKEKKQMYQYIKDRVEPYPKIDKKQSESESEIIEEIKQGELWNTK